MVLLLPFAPGLRRDDTIELVVCNHVDSPECHLWGISDVHLGSPDCDEDMFLEDIAAIRDDPDARVILNGDLLQYDTKKSKGDVYRQMYPPGQQKRIMRDYLMPIKDKILGIIGGNHDEGRTEEDATPILDIAEWLGVPYLQGQGLFKLPVGRRPNNGKPIVYAIPAPPSRHSFGGRLYDKPHPHTYGLSRQLLCTRSPQQQGGRAYPVLRQHGELSKAGHIPHNEGHEAGGISQTGGCVGW